MKYPIVIQNFEHIIEYEYVNIDNTHLIYDLTLILVVFLVPYTYRAGVTIFQHLFFSQKESD